MSDEKSEREPADSVFTGMVVSALLVGIGVALYELHMQIGLATAGKRALILLFLVVVAFAWMYLLGEAIHRTIAWYAEGDDG